MDVSIEHPLYINDVNNVKPLISWLVVSTPSEKNMKVNGKDDILCIMENKTCLKPPTRIGKHLQIAHVPQLCYPLVN